MSVADNFVQKQQKQQYSWNYRPADRFAHLVNTSKHHSGFRSGWRSLRRSRRRKMDVIANITLLRSNDIVARDAI